MANRTILFTLFLSISLFLHAQPWVADQGDGTFQNPILFADYSDPDVIRVGDDFYMVASSFNCMPGIPILHSKDLVNWTIINHIYDRLPFEKYDKPVHGHGSWAPSIRFHNDLFYVYFCTPHEGLFVATAKDPREKWTLEHMVAVELWEDPCPFWDEDGNAYLVRSKLRADILYLHKMSPDGKKLLDNGTIIYHNPEKQPVIEGPKFLKKDGYYYILAPAGGVPVGWQTALRSKSIYGPYEDKIVLHKGNTEINGPHQGGLVSLASGEWWFAHFQDRGVYGRIVHLQPVNWIADWPEMGKDLNDDGIGEPVLRANKPNVSFSAPITVPQMSDEFNELSLGKQWQWHANPQPEWYQLREGNIRLSAVQNLTQNGNFWFVPNLLLQKFPAPSFTATTHMTVSTENPGEKSGLVIMGEEWCYLGLTKLENGYELGRFQGSYYQGSDQTIKTDSLLINSPTIFLQVTVNNGGLCQFSYRSDSGSFRAIGEPFQAKKGRWIGAKVGIFCLNPNISESTGYAEFDWFSME